MSSKHSHILVTSDGSRIVVWQPTYPTAYQPYSCSYDCPHLTINGAYCSLSEQYIDTDKTCIVLLADEQLSLKLALMEL